MILRGNFLNRMWLYVRAGHSSYLMYPIGLSNFVLILWNLGLENVDFVKALFPRLSLFVAVFLPLYLGVAILVGRWHYRNQIKTDSTITYENSPRFMEILERLKRIEAKLEV